MNAHRLGFTLVLCLGGHWLGAGEAPPVRLDARGDELVLANGVVELRLAKDGTLVALSRAGGENLLANGGRGYWNASSAAATQTHGFVALGGPAQVVRQTDDLAEVVFRHEPGGRWPLETFAFDARLHYVLRRGESGFHLFMTAAHRAGMPPASFSQFAYSLRLDPKRFDYIAVDDRRRHVSHTCDDERRAEKIMDATFRLADGTVVSKYDYCHDLELDDYHAYGWASPREGVWLIQPSAEYYPCTPYKLVLTAHQTETTPVIVWQPHCTHGGGVELRCEQGDEWHKLYGPAFVYVNAGDGHDALWGDASRAAREQAARWPYRWMQHPWFPVERGTVTGRLQFGDGRPAREAFVILSPPGVPWSAEGRGYHSWVKTDADGRFTLEHVREGAYTLTATGADEFDEFTRGSIEVKAGQATTLGTLTWTPAAHGRRVWQLGVADRTPGEFRNGDDYRHWGLWRRYPTQFPAGVRFVIGQSKERADWNFAHWNWHCGDPAWTIEFDSQAGPRGKATLTFGIAAALPHDPRRKQGTQRGATDVRVAVNGHEVGRIELPSTGGIGYRSARRSAVYNVVRLPFDAALLKEGRNAVTLRHAHSDAYAPGDPIGEQGAGPGYVMYEAIRLELEEHAMDPQTTDFHVAPGGDDLSPGTKARPLATLHAARDAARKLEPGNPRRIVVEAGEHFLAEPLVLTPEDSGLTIEAKGQAALYGGQKITGWERDGDHLWAAKLDAAKWDFRMLVVNGRFAKRARLPKSGHFTHLTPFDVPWMSTTGGGWKRKPTEVELTTMQYKPEDLPASLDIRNAELTVYHMWDESVVGLKANDPATHTLTFSNPAGHPPGAFGVKKYVVWNVREGMTEPGQWYLDRTAGRVVYWPLPGEDMAKAEVLAPTMESLIRLQGTKEKPVKDVAIRGFTLSVTNTPLKAGGFGAGNFDGAVHLTRTENCRLEGLAIVNVGGQGIKAWEAKGLAVERCHIHHTGACGIKADGEGNTVSDCRIHDVGVTYPSAIGLWVNGKRAKVTHNEVHDTPYTAIASGGEDHLFEANHIYHAMKELHDGAGIYITFCKRVTLRGNFIHDVADTGGYGASAYYLDEQAEDCLVEGNLSLRVKRPSHNHMARKNTLRNNVFVVDGDASLTFPRSSDYRLERNVIVATGKIAFSNPAAIAAFPDNVLFSGAGKVEGQPLKDYSATGTEPLKPGEGSILADPKLTVSEKGKVTFASDSPARRLGIQPLDVSDAGPR